jgi:4-hydroxy-tetrahydrodipicolinate synthase
MARFGRVLTAMVTPFTEGGELDLDRAAELARWLVAQGNDGLVVAGTTGESPTLPDAQRLDLFRAVRAAVDVPLIAGSTTNDTGHSVTLTEEATEIGYDGILAVTPYYNRPSQAGLLVHFRAIAASTDRPVMLYDIPIRTGRKITNETMLELAHDVDNVVAVKDAAGDLSGTARLVRDAPADFEVYSGEDRLTLPLLAVGAVGTVGVATHWCAREQAEVIDAFASGDVARAREVNARLLRSFAFEGTDEAPNPVPTKVMLEVLGMPVGSCRGPMGPVPPGLADEARAVAAELGVRADAGAGAVAP